MKSIAGILNTILDVEGGDYTNDPADSGGPTKWGWTLKSLREIGYQGRVQDLTREEAFDMYYRRFVIRSGYREVLEVSDDIGAELVDTAVNMGEGTAGKFLQVALNAFNNNQKIYPDIEEDGIVGRNTVKALAKFLNYRGADGERVMMKALNCLQGARYIELSRNYPKNERFAYGWILNRVEV